MSIFNSAVLTQKGNELLVTAASGRQIIFTRLVTGSGIYTEEEKSRSALERAEGLKQQRQDFPFSKYEKASEKSVILTALITNKELNEGYKITEIGVYGKEVGAEEDFLCSIATTKSLEETDSFPPYNGLRECQIVQDYYITISSDAEVEINTQGAVALVEDFEKFKETIYNHITVEIENNKTTLVATEENIPVDERKKGTWYLVIDGEAGSEGNNQIKASPNMGLRVVERSDEEDGIE